MDESSNTNATRWSIEKFDPRRIPNDTTPQQALAEVHNIIPHVEEQLVNDQRRYQLSQQPSDAKNRDYSERYLQYLNDWCQQLQERIQAAAQQANAQNVAGHEGVLVTPATLESRLVAARTTGFRRCLVERHDNSNETVYMLVRKIRDTIYGSVRQAQATKPDPSNHQQLLPIPDVVAIKIYTKEYIAQGVNKQGVSVQENPERELSIQQCLGQPGHPNVLYLRACLEDDDRIFAVFPMVTGGELFDYVSQNAPLTETQVRNMMYIAFDAARYCHNKGVCHRDISLENFLLGGEHQDLPILIDFGLSYPMQPDPQGGWLPIPHTGAVGKYYYMAPEIYAGQSNPPYDGPKADIWSLGVCMFIMLFGYPPWTNPSNLDARFTYIVRDRNLRQLLVQWGIAASEQAVDLLEKIFVLQPMERPSIEEILGHPFFQEPMQQAPQ